MIRPPPKSPLFPSPPLSRSKPRVGKRGPRAPLPEGRAVPHARRARRPPDRLGDPAGDRDPRARARLAPGRDRGAAPAHRGGGTLRDVRGGEGAPPEARRPGRPGAPPGEDDPTPDLAKP